MVFGISDEVHNPEFRLRLVNAALRRISDPALFMESPDLHSKCAKPGDPRTGSSLCSLQRSSKTLSTSRPRVATGFPLSIICAFNQGHQVAEIQS